MSPEEPNSPQATPARAGAGAAFATIALPRRLYIPYLATLVDGAPPILPLGSRVSRGELLLAADSAQPHLPIASRNATVVGLSRVSLVEDSDVVSIVVDVEHDAHLAGTGSIAPGANPDMLAALLPRVRDANFGEWIDLFRRGGIWADRWGSPDLIGQLHQTLSRPVDTVICNLLEEDPAVGLQGRIAATWPVEIVAGIAGLAALSGAGKSWIVAPQEATAASFAALRSACAAGKTTFIPLPNPYPQSHPSLLIHELMGRHLSPGRLPTEQGVLLLDGAAAAAVGRFFLSREPMLAVPVGLYDLLDRTLRFVVADIGTSLEDLFAAAGFDSSRTVFRAGAPLRDVRMGRHSVVHGGELTLYASPEPIDINPNPCIRCAWCVEACPVRIQPAGLLEAAQRNDRALAEEYGLSACIKCGICSYVCPSHLPILRGIQSFKVF